MRAGTAWHWLDSPEAKAKNRHFCIRRDREIRPNLVLRSSPLNVARAKTSICGGEPGEGHLERQTPSDDRQRQHPNWTSNSPNLP